MGVSLGFKDGVVSSPTGLKGWCSRGIESDNIVYLCTDTRPLALVLDRKHVCAP